MSIEVVSAKTKIKIFTTLKSGTATKDAFVYPLAPLVIEHPNGTIMKGELEFVRFYNQNKSAEFSVSVCELNDDEGITHLDLERCFITFPTSVEQEAALLERNIVIKEIRISIFSDDGIEIKTLIVPPYN